MKKLLLLSLFSLLFIPTLSSAQTTGCVSYYNGLSAKTPPWAPVYVYPPTGCTGPIKTPIQQNPNGTCNWGYYPGQSSQASGTASKWIAAENRSQIWFYEKDEFNTPESYAVNWGTCDLKLEWSGPGYACNKTNPLMPKCEYKTSGYGNTPLAQCSASCKIDSKYYADIAIYSRDHEPDYIDIPFKDDFGDQKIFQVGHRMDFSPLTNLHGSLRYSWDLGDNKRVNTDNRYYFEDNPVSYLTPGTKNIKLNIQDTTGQTYISTSTTIHIIPKLETQIYADGKLLKPEIDNVFPLNKPINFSLKSNLSLAPLPNIRDYIPYSYLDFEKLGGNDVASTIYPKPNYDSAAPFIFKAPGRYKLKGKVYRFSDPAEVSDLEVSTTTNVVIDCSSELETELKTREIVNSLMAGKVVDIYADNLGQWLNKNNAKVIKAMMTLQCSNSTNESFIGGYRVIRELLNNDPSKKPLQISIGKSFVDGMSLHAVIAVSVSKNKDNSKINSIKVVDPNYPSQANTLSDCFYSNKVVDLKYIPTYYIDETGGALLCNYPYDEMWSWGGYPVAVATRDTYKNERDKLTSAAYTYCQRSDVFGALCNRYLKFGDWLKASLPFDLENFGGDLPGTEGGSCSGWSSFVTRVTYLGNFVGKNTCKLTLEDTPPSVAAAGLPDLPNLLFKIREFLNQSMPLLKLNK